jgi:hypothetical protein
VDTEWCALVCIYGVDNGAKPLEVHVVTPRIHGDSWFTLRARIIELHGEFLLNLAASAWGDDVYWDPPEDAQ